MPSWLKKAFGKKDEREPPPSPATRPSTSGTQSSSSSQQRPSHRSSTPSSSSRIYSGVVHNGGGTPPPRPQNRTRVSTHDITMAAVTLGVAPPPSPSPAFYSPASGSSSATGSLRPDIQQQQIDSDLAMAYSLAQQEQQSGASSNGGGQQQQRMQSIPPPLPPVPQPQRPLPPLPQQQQQQHPGMPVTSPFGDAVSLPPPAAGTRPDLAMAAALAESQFAARQADELARTTEAVYQAAVNKALEASLQTVSYDDVLRDIKLWIIDLAASTDDVLAALDSVVKQRHDVAVRLEKALDADDERKIRKLGFMAEQLPNVEEKLRTLADKMMPIGVAVVELQDLRDHIGATAPPLEEAGRQRDLILLRLFKAMEDAGLRPPSRSSDYYNEIGVNSDGAGPSTSSRPATPLQAPNDLRDLVAALIDEAQKLPKMPKRRKSSGSIATSATTATTSLADPSEVRDLPMTPSGGGGGGGGGGSNEDHGEGTPESAAPGAAVVLAGATATAAAASVGGLLSSLSKEENNEDEMEQQPSAPEKEDSSASASAVLATPLGNDLISFEEEEEEEAAAIAVVLPEPVPEMVSVSEALQPHRLEISEEEEEGEHHQAEEPPKQQQEQPPIPTAVAPPPSPAVPSIPTSPVHEQQHQLQPQPEVAETSTTPSSIANGDDMSIDTNEEKKNTTASKKTPLWRRLSSRSPVSASTPGSGASSSIPSATSTPSSSQRRTSPGTFTTPVPFQLSSSRWKAKGPSEAPTAADTLRRMPALISLHYEMEKDSGVVADAVGWTTGPANSTNHSKIEIGPAVVVPPPAALHSGTSFETPYEMVRFVKSQPEGSLPTIVPSRFDASSRWSVMCAAAGVYDALTMAIEELSSWEIKTPSTAGAAAAAASVVSEAHRLVDYLARVSSILSTVAHTHDPLRHALVKHRLPWEESLTTQVRWAAQIAGIAVITQAIDVSEEAERTKGAWQRQAVLKPLGHGVMAAFSVHQLAGGFGSEASSACEYLVERTVHYARMIDPKWFRGHKVVSS